MSHTDLFVLYFVLYRLCIVQNIMMKFVLGCFYVIIWDL